MLAALHAQRVAAQGPRGRHGERQRHGTELIHRQLPPDDDLVVGIAGHQFDRGGIERTEGVLLAPPEDALHVQRLARAVDRFVGVQVADQLARRGAQGIGPGVGDGNGLAAARQAEQLVDIPGQRRSPRAVRLCGARRDGLAAHHGLHLAAGHRLAGEPVGRKQQQLSGRRLRDQANVRHHHDGVGPQPIVRSLDQIQPGRVYRQRDATELGVAVIG